MEEREKSPIVSTFTCTLQCREIDLLRESWGLRYDRWRYALFQLVSTGPLPVDLLRHTRRAQQSSKNVQLFQLSKHILRLLIRPKMSSRCFRHVCSYRLLLVSPSSSIYASLHPGQTWRAESQRVRRSPRPAPVRMECIHAEVNRLPIALSGCVSPTFITSISVELTCLHAF